MNDLLINQAISAFKFVYVILVSWFAHNIEFHNDMRKK